MLIAALAPAIMLGLLIYYRDRNHPEPLKWLLGATALGALCLPCVLVTLSGYTLTDEYHNISEAVADAFLGAAIPEESFKFIMLLIVARFCKQFDEMFDGIVYAVCVGLGFAAVENIFYVFGSEDAWLITSVTRALMAVPAHYFFAVIMGAFFARGWFIKDDFRMVNFALALLLPILAHGIYDTFCFTVSIDEETSMIVLILFFVFFKFIRRRSMLLVATAKLHDKLSEIES